MNKIISLFLGAFALISLTACGGGGSEKEGPQNKITYFNVVPNQHQMVHMKAGESLPLFATAETFGPSLKSISWSAVPAKSTTVGTFEIDDSACENMEFSNREVPGSKDVNVGTGYCETFAKANEDASGYFNVFAKVTASDGTQRTEKVEVNIIPREKVFYDFNLKAYHSDNVQVGQSIRLMADIISDKAIPASAEVSYQWKVVSKPHENATVPLIFDPLANNASIIISYAGTYLLEASVTVKTRDQVKTKYAIVKIDISKPLDGSGYFGLTVNATTEQPTVLVDAPSKLTANFSLREGTVLSAVNYAWKQISGPKAVITGEDRKSAYVVPSAAGTMVFQVEVSIVSNSMLERESAIISVVAEPKEEPAESIHQ